MYIWKTNKLARDLSLNNVSELEKMKYLLGTQILYTFFTYHALITISEIDYFFLLEALVVMMIAIWGVLKSYQANGGSDGKGLLEYFVCLSFPLTIKITIVVWIIFYFYHWIGGFLFDYFTIEEPELIHKFIIFVIAILVQFIFFWRVAIHIGRIKKYRDSEC